MFKSKKIGQVGLLYLSMLLNLGFGVVINVINTRFLGPVQFGNFKFLQNLYEFVTSLLTLGVFASGAMVLAKNDDKQKRREISGALVVASAVVSIVFMLIVLVFSFFENHIFKNELAWLIRLSLPLLFVFPFKMFLERALQGENRIVDLALLQCSPQLIYIMLALSTYYLSGLYLDNAQILYLISLALVVAALTVRLSPRFIKLKENLEYLWVGNRQYGNNVYISQLAGLASAQLSIFFLAYYVNAESVGFFYLATTICYPLTMIPVVMGKVMFREFASRDKIPLRATILSLIMSAFSLVGFLLIIKPLMVFLFTDKYLTAVHLSYYISIGSIAHGFGDYIVFFMGAHGRGVEIRNAAIFVGLVNVIGYGLLVKLLGLNGAMLTKICASIAYCIFNLYYYKFYTHSIA